MHRMTNRAACRHLNWDRKDQANEKATGHLGFLPRADYGPALNDHDDLAVSFFYMDQRRAGFTVKQAGIAATRLRDGMRAYPGEGQLTVIVLENGSISIHPTAALDLTTGFNSGGRVAIATMIEVANLRRRADAAFAAEGAIVGDHDED